MREPAKRASGARELQLSGLLFLASLTFLIWACGVHWALPQTLSRPEKLRKWLKNKNFR